MVALADQSVFVRASIQGVVREALIAAGLTGLMILLFLGSWRSTLIVCISIPLSILTSLCMLSLLGQTINVMTLGGLALAVGILVDDATVEIENTHRNLAMRKPLLRAVLDGAPQIAVPTFVATLSICIVFVPVLLLTGTARYLFTPLAMAVVFAMLASYFLSRTLVPTMVAYLLKSEVELVPAGGARRDGRRQGSHLARPLPVQRAVRAPPLPLRGPARLVAAASRAGPDGVHGSLDRLAGPGLAGRRGLLPQCRFRPDAAARALPGRHAHRSRPRCGSPTIEREIRNVIPADEIDALIDNIGIPNSWTSIAQGDIPTISSADGEILISLKKEKHGSTRDYEVLLRKRLREKFPGHVVLLPAGQYHHPDFELRPARLPSICRSSGGNAEANYKIAQKLAERIARIPGAADVHVHQVVDQPQIRLNVDRVKASQLGLTQRDVTSSMLISLSGNGISGAEFLGELGQRRQLQRRRADAAVPGRFSGCPAAHSDFRRDQRGQHHHPDSQAGAAGAGNASVGASPNGILSGLRKSRRHGGQHAAAFESGHVQRDYAPVIVNHYNVWPVFDVYANVDRRDLGGVGARSGEDHARGGTPLAARHFVRAARADRDHAILLLPPRTGHGLRRGSGVSPHDGELSVVARSVHHPDGSARARWPAFCGCCSSPAPR